MYYSIHEFTVIKCFDIICWPSPHLKSYKLNVVSMVVIGLSATLPRGNHRVSTCRRILKDTLGTLLGIISVKWRWRIFGFKLTQR